MRIDIGAVANLLPGKMRVKDVFCPVRVVKGRGREKHVSARQPASVVVTDAPIKAFRLCSADPRRNVSDSLGISAGPARGENTRTNADYHPLYQTKKQAPSAGSRTRPARTVLSPLEVMLPRTTWGKEGSSPVVSVSPTAP